MTQSRDTGWRSVAVEVDIGAPPAQVWHALTDAAELVRWFSLEAHVIPGTGGEIYLSWGEPFVAAWRIEIWEPEHRLRVLETDALGGGLQPQEGADTDRPGALADCAKRVPARTVDFWFEAQGARTILRLVHDGFSPGSDATLAAAVRRGWEFELRSLRHYLERHAGIERDVVWLRWASSLSEPAIWNRMMRSLGWGDPGSAMQGTVQIYDPPYQLALTVTDHCDALFRIKLAKEATGAVEVNVWLSSWQCDGITLARFEQHMKDLFEPMFAPSVAKVTICRQATTREAYSGPYLDTALAAPQARLLRAGGEFQSDCR